MEKLSMLKTMTFSFLVAFVFFSLSPTATSQKEVEEESEFSYDPNSPIGPANWGQIHPEWFLCGNGTMQSPIDLRKATIVSQFKELQTVYNPSISALVNRGHDICWTISFNPLTWGGNPGYIQINETMYYIDQCHWHTPSEHTIEGQRYDLEIHCVHESNTGRTAVIAILYKTGLVSDPFLALLTAPLITLANGLPEAPAGIIDPRQIQSDFSQYYRYIGSLTIPPCTEDVVWTVVKQIRSVAKAQVNLLQQAVDDGFGNNARPLQLLNNRTVLLFKPM